MQIVSKLCRPFGEKRQDPAQTAFTERQTANSRGREYRRHMTTEYVTMSDKVRIGAGTALKFGFFAAFGVFLFYVILSVVLGVVALLLAAAGAFDINRLLPG
jgi:hypothetical protein